MAKPKYGANQRTANQLARNVHCADDCKDSGSLCGPCGEHGKEIAKALDQAEARGRKEILKKIKPYVDEAKTKLAALQTAIDNDQPVAEAAHAFEDTVYALVSSVSAPLQHEHDDANCDICKTL